MKQDSSQVIVPAPLINYSLFSDLQCSIRITSRRARQSTAFSHSIRGTQGEIKKERNITRVETLKISRKMLLFVIIRIGIATNSLFTTITKSFILYISFFKFCQNQKDIYSHFVLPCRFIGQQDPSLKRGDIQGVPQEKTNKLKIIILQRFTHTNIYGV